MADFSFGQLLSDPNFQNLLAGTGARLGAGGAGEAIGLPAQQLIQSQASQKALAEQNKKRDDFMQQLLQALGGFTPKGQPGLESMTVGPEKTSVDIINPMGSALKTPREALSLTDIAPF
jgi:shikimate 5-dehydrogenase